VLLFLLFRFLFFLLLLLLFVLFPFLVLVTFDHVVFLEFLIGSLGSLSVGVEAAPGHEVLGDAKSRLQLGILLLHRGGLGVAVLVHSTAKLVCFKKRLLRDLFLV
jgi:hypothetical protein